MEGGRISSSETEAEPRLVAGAGARVKERMQELEPVTLEEELKLRRWSGASPVSVTRIFRRPAQRPRRHCRHPPAGQSPDGGSQADHAGWTLSPLEHRNRAVLLTRPQKAFIQTFRPD